MRRTYQHSAPPYSSPPPPGHLQHTRTGSQATVYATLTDATLTALADILDPG